MTYYCYSFEALIQENDELVAKVSHLQQVSQDNENLNQLLKNKCEYSEKLTLQLEKENRLLDEVRAENLKLKDDIIKKEQAHKLEVAVYSNFSV